MKAFYFCYCTFIFYLTGSLIDNEGQLVTHGKRTVMHKEIELVESIVPDLTDVLKRRVLILRNINWSEPVGRRLLAQTLEMSERTLRTETDYLKKQELIATTKSGMVITHKGKKLLTGLSGLMTSLLGLESLELQLKQKLGIDECFVVAGDSDQQPNILEDLGKLTNDLLADGLPKGPNVIAVMGGSTMAKIANTFTSEIAKQREITFVPARGGMGERLDFQANNVCGLMAQKTGGQYRSLYVPEQVSEDTYRPLLNEPSVQEVVKIIRSSNAVIHGIGEASEMAKRRGMSKKAISMLEEKDAVAEAFGYFFNDKGEVVYKIPRIGLQLEDLTQMDRVFAIAGGKKKARAIAAYMKNAPEKTCLITDEGAAKMILKG